MSWLEHTNNSNKFKQTYLQGFLDVSGNLIVREGDVSMNQRLDVHGDVSMNRNVDICGNFYAQYPDGSIPSSAIIGGSAGSTGTQGDDGATGPAGPIGPTGFIDTSSDVTFSGEFTIDNNKNLIMTDGGKIGIGISTPTKELEIDGDISLNGNLNTVTSSEIGHLSGINGNIQSQINNKQAIINANNKVLVEFINFNSHVIMNDKLTITDDLSLNGRLFVNGDVSMNGDVTIVGNLKADMITNEYIINTETTNFSLIVAEDLSINGRLFVSEDVSFNENVFIAGDLSVNGLIQFPDDSIPLSAIVGNGPTGPIGHTGLKGDDGNDGAVGSTGPVGEKGEDGNDGAIGSTGPRGHTGEKGDNGNDGEVGPIGHTGEKGEDGNDGAIGSTGPRGHTGEKGNQGNQGHTGEKGNPGSVGIRGFQGHTGLQGPTGEQGLHGHTGLQGLGHTGIQGPTGEQGLRGHTGLQGFGHTGLQGPTGSNGQVGPIGPTGPSGGPIGPTGPIGPSGGPIGPTGPAGSGSGGGSSLIEYMTGSIYGHTGNTYNDKLYVTYGKLDGGSKTVYYMSRIKKPETYDYEWYYTSINPIGSKTLEVIDNWGPNIPVPVINSYATASYSEGQTITDNVPNVTVTIYGPVLSYAIVPTTIIAQTGLEFNTTTGVISGTVDQLTEGSYDYDITATNVSGTSNPYPITIVITDNLATPNIQNYPTSVTYTTLSDPATITPTINVPSTWTVVPGFPSYISLNSSNGIITVTPTTLETLSNESYAITATNSDVPPENDIKTIAFTITLATPNITGYTPTTITEGQSVILTPQGSNLTNGTNNFFISSNNNTGNTITQDIGLSIAQGTGIITGQVTQETEGYYNYTVSHYNTEDTGNDFTFTINVQDDVVPPIINYSISSYEFIIGNSATTVVPTNTGGPVKSNGWSMHNSTPLTNGLALNVDTGKISGVISGTVTEGPYTYTIIATNTDNETDSTTISITFKQPIPVINYNNPTWAEGTTGISILPSSTTNLPLIALNPYQITTETTSGNTLFTDLGFTFNSADGKITGDVAQQKEGTYRYNITAENSGGVSTSYLLTITITDDVDEPSIGNTGSLTRSYKTLDPVDIINLTVNVNSTWTINPTSSYITLTPNNSGTQCNVSITPVSQGVLSSTDFDITATNNDTPAETDTVRYNFTITLATPQINGYTNVSNNAISVTEGSSYTLTPIGNYLTDHGNNYTLTSNNIGLSINQNTGIINGTIVQNKEGGPYTYTVTHYNSEGNGNSFAIAVTVVDNIPDPTISYSASTYTGNVNTYLTIPAPTSSNVSSFTIVSGPALPSTLSLDSGTGSITGTPSSTSSYTYTITATNNDTPTESVTTQITITISPAAGTGLQIIPPMPNPTYPTSNISGGQPYIGSTSLNSIYFFIYANSTYWSITDLDKYDSINMSTSYSYTSTYTTIPSLISGYANNSSIYEGQTYIGYDTSTSKVYIMVKLPNPSYDPSNPYSNAAETVYYRKELSVMPSRTWDYNNSWTANSTYESLPDIDGTYNDGQVFIGRTTGNAYFLLIKIPDPTNTSNSQFYEFPLSSSNPDLDTSFTY